MQHAHLPVIAKKSRWGEVQKAPVRRGYNPRYTEHRGGQTHLCGWSPKEIEAVNRIFDGTSLLATQGPDRRRSPELDIMHAILLDAVQSIQLALATNSKRARSLAYDALTWMLQREVEWMYSCENICLFLNFEYSLLRQWALKIWKVHFASAPQIEMFQIAS